MLLSPSVVSLFHQHGTNIKVDKDRPIFKEGEQSSDIFLIISGSVSINKDTESGKLMTLRIVGATNCIGETAVFSDNAVHSFSAITMEQTQLAVLNRKRFEELLINSTGLMVEWTKYIQLIYLKNQTRFRDLMLNGKKGALYSTLIRMANTYGISEDDGSIKIDYPLTNQELANLCAMSREVVNRMLNDLKNEGTVSFHKGFITIHRLDRLKTENQCEDCPLCICRID